MHGPHQNLKITTTVNNNNNTNNNNLRLPNAVESFPNEVGLCKTGVPGAGYGVCARQLIPVGTWIGPYEGEKVRPEQVSLGADASYMWEIYHEGKLLYYIDGRDENKSSWMRYIRCARHKGEQNMFAFQYYGNIYYRAFRDIPAGTELLVWYDDKYPQYMGIPLEIRDTYPVSSVDYRQHPEMVVAVPRENVQPRPTHGYPPSSRLLTDNHPKPNPQSTPVRPLLPPRDSSRDQSHGKSRARRRSSQHVRQESSRASLAAEGYDPVRQVSRTHDDGGTRFNAPVKSFPLEDASFSRESQALSQGARNVITPHAKTNGHGDVTGSLGSHGDDSKITPPVPEENQSKSADEEEVSSDGSDASFFNCGQCGKTFAQRSVLQIHVCPNIPNKPYHCGHCTQSFDRPNELRMHAVTHTAEKPFKCGFCSRSFAGATTLHNHVRTHTGEKPFSCERCGKTFTQASQLHRHEAIPGDCDPYDSLQD